MKSSSKTTKTSDFQTGGEGGGILMEPLRYLSFHGFIHLYSLLKSPLLRFLSLGSL